jgi:acetyltransferase
MELADGKLVTFRMMRPEDSQLYQEFVTGLSDQSRYLRFFSGIKQLPSYMLEELTNPKFPISYALIATIPEADGEREIGVARYAPTDDDRTAEFAVIVADEWQGHGIASQLMRAIITAAAIGGIKRIEGIVLMENAAMLGLAESLGFNKTSGSDAGPSIVRVVKDLKERKPEAP